MLDKLEAFVSGNPGRSQLRIAYVESPERMHLVPALLAELFTAYQSTAG
jgi:hypothetical protein